MPKFRTELFGQLIYDPEISYEDLLPLEDELTALVTAKLEEFRGRFIHFESEGDNTYFQCVFQDFSSDLFTRISTGFTTLLAGRGEFGDRIECKLFFVDKELSGAHFYTLAKGKTNGRKLDLPPAGPIDKALREGRKY